MKTKKSGVNKISKNTFLYGSTIALIALVVFVSQVIQNPVSSKKSEASAIPTSGFNKCMSVNHCHTLKCSFDCLSNVYTGTPNATQLPTSTPVISQDSNISTSDFNKCVSVNHCNTLKCSFDCLKSVPTGKPNGTQLPTSTPVISQDSNISTSDFNKCVSVNHCNTLKCSFDCLKSVPTGTQ